MGKKFVSIGLSLALFLNLCPIKSIVSYAQEANDEEQVVDATTANETQKSKIQSRSYGETKEATVTTTVNIENGDYGKIEGLDTNPVVMKSVFKDEGKKIGIVYVPKWNLQTDDTDKDKTISVIPQRGYQYTLERSLGVASYIQYEGTNLGGSLISKDESTQIIFKSITTLLNETVNGTLDIKFSEKKDAQHITTKITGNGEVKLLDDDVYYTTNEDGNTVYTVEKDGKIKLEITPQSNQEVEINGNTLELEEGQTSITKEFSQDDLENGIIDIQFKQVVPSSRLNVNVTGKGTVLLNGKSIKEDSEDKQVKLNDDQTYKATIKAADDNYIESVKLGDKELQPNDDKSYDITVNKDNLSDLNVVFKEKIETKIEIESTDLAYTGKDQGLSFKIVGSDGTELEGATVEYEKGIFPYDKVTPNKEGTYKYSITYPGNYKYKSCNSSGKFTIKDKREEVEIKVDESTLKMKYNGQVQHPTATVFTKDGQKIDDVNLKYAYSLTGIAWQDGGILGYGQNIGKYKCKISFEGNEFYKPTDEIYAIEIYDGRYETSIVIDESELTKVYNGEVQKPKATVEYTDENNEKQVIENAEVEIKYISGVLNSEYFTAGKDAGTYKFTATYKGDEFNYKNVTTTGELTITKCTPEVSVPNKVAKCTGSAVRSDVTITPKCGYINVYTGVDRKLNSKVYVDLNLGDDKLSQEIESYLEGKNIANGADLKEAISTIKDIPVLGTIINKYIDLDAVLKILELVPDDAEIAFGAPVTAGLYNSTVVVLDTNAEVTTGSGTLLLYRTMGKIVFTEESPANFAKIKQGTEYNYKAVYEGTEREVNIKYTGITSKFKTYSSSERPTEPGVYTVTASSSDDIQYLPSVSVRTFTIKK